jgi:P27 family predicted phage terminase small subunit
MANPRPTPTHLKLLRGCPSHAKPINRFEPEPTVPADLPDPPDYLSPMAVEEWRRITKELLRLRLFTVVDANPLAAYCQSYGRWVDAERKLASIRAVNPDAALLVKGSLGNPIPNPLIKIARLAALDMLKYASEFGFTPAARSRIISPDGPGGGPPSKFRGLLVS